MNNYKIFRIAGHLILLSIMAATLNESDKLFKEYEHKILEVQMLKKMQTRFLTMWAVAGQMIYALLALLCDLSEVLKLNLPKWLMNFRHNWFAGVVVPATMRICVFWPIYLYDKELAAPKNLLVMLPPFINFCIHGLVYIYMFWEFLFLPEDVPKKNNLSFTMMWTGHVTCVSLLFYTRYGDFGVWPYVIMKKLEGSILLYALTGFVTYITFASYFYQFTLKKALWERREKLKVV